MTHIAAETGEAYPPKGPILALLVTPPGGAGSPNSTVASNSIPRVSAVMLDASLMRSSLILPAFSARP